ncbi:MAG: STM4014 family protein [Gallionellaceae bacterium]
MSHSLAPLVLIGNPENRRVTQFQEALTRSGQRPATLLSYLDILERRIALPELLHDAKLIRIESPGENFKVEKLLLALGGLEGATHLLEERGRIFYPGLWYSGFCRLLRAIARDAGEVSWFNHPDDIVRMFDKPLLKKLVPAHSLPACPTFANYNAFFEFVSAQDYPRFFIKLNYGSSASCVLAYEYNRKTGQAQAQTTIELVRDGKECRFYNSLKPKKYTNRLDLSSIIDFLFCQGAYVERWIPKARHATGVYDLRILAIRGRRHHSIARLSRTPITNLHLGNQRCSVDQLGLSDRTWREIDVLVAEVMACFPASLYAGLDVVLPRNGTSPILLEANAFGDLLPGLLHDGQSSYQSELVAV